MSGIILPGQDPGPEGPTLEQVAALGIGLHNRLNELEQIVVGTVFNLAVAFGLIEVPGGEEQPEPSAEESADEQH